MSKNVWINELEHAFSKSTKLAGITMAKMQLTKN